MDETDHVEIADAIISRLSGQGIVSFKSVSASGSVYVYIIGSKQKIRIANHAKHRGWFRYNVRTDLKKSREFKILGQRVYFFTGDDVKNVCFRIGQDYKKETIRNANALIKRRKRRTYSDGKKNGREGKRSFCEERTGEENHFENSGFKKETCRES